jgi:glutamyl/glutaminyl-tRNA synthetase
VNTRFNPTCNGRLHVGHLYLILVNYHMAKASGGKFIVRFDDDQPGWFKLLGIDKVYEFRGLIRSDLEWLGIEVDAWTSERESRYANEVDAGSLLLPNHIPDAVEHKAHIESKLEFMYPYVPYLTLVKVVQDHREGIDTLIRGEDLITEYSLYSYFCQLRGLPTPKFYYLPRLRRQDMGALTDVSKTAGNFKIADYRERYWDPKSLIAALGRCCLENPSDGWTYANVKQMPILEFTP